MTQKIWQDESGVVIPANRITPSEKLRERTCEKLLKEALKVNSKLEELKILFSELSDEVYNAVMEENGVNTDERKGYFTYYNFDRSIKVQVDISERIEFDDALIAVAKGHLDEFITNATGTAIDGMIREMINDAFSTSRGKLDTKKVLNLTRYRSRVDSAKYPNFHLALDAIEKAIRKPSSKRYFRIFTKDGDKEYEAINLNFSAT